MAFNCETDSTCLCVDECHDCSSVFKTKCWLLRAAIKQDALWLSLFQMSFTALCECVCEGESEAPQT